MLSFSFVAKDYKRERYRGGSRGRVQGVRTPPPPWGEPLFFVFTFKICLPHQSVTPFLSGAPPPKKNPGSASEVDSDPPVYFPRGWCLSKC